jgi:hypothetical protein
MGASGWSSQYDFHFRILLEFIVMTDDYIEKRIDRHVSAGVVDSALLGFGPCVFLFIYLCFGLLVACRFFTPNQNRCCFTYLSMMLDFVVQSLNRATLCWADCNTPWLIWYYHSDISFQIYMFSGIFSHFSISTPLLWCLHTKLKMLFGDCYYN